MTNNIVIYDGGARLAEKLKRVRNFLLLYTVGSVGYGIIEVLFRGFTHWSMLFTGGLCFLIIYCVNEMVGKRLFFVKCLLGAVAITLMELVVGLIFNRLLGMDVWDYSTLPYNLFGQISLLFSSLWFLLCIPLIWICNYMKKILNK